MMNSKTSLLVLAGIVMGAAGTGMYVSRAGQMPAKSIYSAAARPVSFTTSNSAVKSLQDLDQAFAALTDYVSPSVVHVKTTANMGNGATEVGQGSGVIFRADGYIVTNDHVVASSDGTVQVVLNDGRELQGKVIRSNDVSVDLAVIKVNAKDLPAAPFADSDSVRPGEFALAFGAPFGIENTVTVGHISGLGRTNAIGDPQIQATRRYSSLIQTDAPINPGNSGGPLVNIKGEVIGINSAIASTSSGLMGGTAGSVGIGFAIPSNQVQLLAQIMIEKGKLTRGYMGVAPRDLKPYEKKEMNLESGAYLEQVPNTGPGTEAGLRKGDIVTRIGSQPIRGEQDLRLSMFRFEPGSKVQVQYLRDGKAQSTNVTIGKAPADTQLTQQPRQMNQGNGMVPPNMRQFFQHPDTTPFPNDDFNAPNGQGQDDEDQQSAPKANPSQPRLGVGIVDLSDSMRNGHSIPKATKGAFVQTVESGSIAESLGIQAGDVITMFNGKPVSNAQGLIDQIHAMRRGQQGSIRAERFGQGGSGTIESTFRF